MSPDLLSSDLLWFALGVAVTSWADQLSGEQGWWFALTSGSTLIAIGWTLGDRSDRDAEIARAFARRAPGAVAC